MNIIATTTTIASHKQISSNLAAILEINSLVNRIPRIRICNPTKVNSLPKHRDRIRIHRTKVKFRLHNHKDRIFILRTENRGNFLAKKTSLHQTLTTIIIRIINQLLILQNSTAYETRTIIELAIHKVKARTVTLVAEVVVEDKAEDDADNKHCHVYFL